MAGPVTPGNSSGDGRDEFEVRAADDGATGVRVDRGPADEAPVDDVLEFGAAHHVPPVHLPSRWTGRFGGVRPGWLPGWVTSAHRVPTIALLIGVAAGVAIAIAVMGGQPTKVIVKPGPSASPVQGFAVGNPALAAMIELADSSTPLQNVPIPTDTRPRCPAGSAQFPDPVDAVVAAVRTHLPEYTFLDASRGVDLGGVCSVRVRERSPAGPVLVISVDSPPNSGGVPWVLIENRDDDTLIDVLVLSDDWRIEILTIGTTGLQPRSTDLQNIAADPRLVWS